MAAAVTRAIGDEQTGIGYAQVDADEAQRRLTRDFTQYLMPQLQSSIAARGQHYSSARQKEERRAGENFFDSSYDIQSTLNRQMDDLRRQSMYAAMGLVI